MNEFGFGYAEQVYRAACSNLRVAIQLNPNVDDSKEYVVWVKWYYWDEGVVYVCDNETGAIKFANNLINLVGRS